MNKMLFSILLIIASITPSLADGMLLQPKPELPAFSVSYHNVDVVIDRQIAKTEVDQSFHNESNVVTEGTYMFPIDDSKTISKFVMYNGNEELKNRILEKDEAAKIYNNIVRQRKDPALLQWINKRMIQARVFPIEPHGDKRIKLGYQELLTAKNNVVKYVYPMKTEMISSKPLAKCTVRVNIISDKPIMNIYSPSHKISVKRVDERHADVYYYESNVLPDEDFVLYYSVSTDNIGVDLLAYTESGTKDGYFIMMVAPQLNISQNEIQPKDFVFVIDTSGSMSGDKISKAKAALKYCIKKLDDKDRFNIVAFSNDVKQWKSELKNADGDNIFDAIKYTDDINATGGTNIDDAMRSVLKIMNESNGAVKRLRNIIFITDGQPTVGETNTEKILLHVKDWNKNNTSIYNFGVGVDYNAPFLDKLAEENNGIADNVLPDEDLDKKVATFYNSISSPVFTNITADWGTARVFDLFPDKIPNIYKGSQILITGRYKADGNLVSTLTLKGLLAGKDKDFKYSVNWPSAAFDDENIPKLWATRKLGNLENQLRLKGVNKEILAELIDLSKKYGIISQYTSFLIDIDETSVNRQNRLFMDKKSQINDAYDRVGEKAKIVAGAPAVSQSYNVKSYNNAAQYAKKPQIMNDLGEIETFNQLRNVSQRSFVQNGKQWIDVNYQNQKNVIKVKAFSPAYFQLANAHPQMQQYLSMGNEVIISLKDTAIQTGEEGKESEFTAAELKPLVEKMNSEFINPAKPVNNAGLINVPKSFDFTWLAISIAVMSFILIRRRKVSA